jgi:hypothetical protein
MVRWFRRSAGLTTPLALVIATMVALGSFDWWHPDDDDGAPASFHDHNAHHPLFAATRSTSRAPEHCALCHWLRTLSNGFGSVAQYRLASVKGGQVLHAIDYRTTRLIVAILPARAPPA